MYLLLHIFTIIFNNNHNKKYYKTVYFHSHVRPVTVTQMDLSSKLIFNLKKLGV